MKISWKLFFVLTPVIIIFMTIFGTWLVQDGFHNDLKKETQRCVLENQMFERSFELVTHSMSDSDNISINRIVESFHTPEDVNDGCAKVLDSDLNILYEDNLLMHVSDIPFELADVLKNSEDSTAWKTIKEEERYYILILSKGIDGQYIESIHHISDIYKNRDEQLNKYRIAMLLGSLLIGFLTFLILLIVLKPIGALSQAVRKYADGQHDIRVKNHSRDEIGVLTSDFNWMADVMNRQMLKMQGEVERQESFTSAFAHELKTPLTSIIGYADTLRSTELSKQEADMCADYIYRQGKRLQSLSYKLLEMSMTDSYSANIRPVSVKELVDTAVETVSDNYRSKHLQLHVEVKKGTIQGDFDLLVSLLVNLLDNARKASDEGKTVTVSGYSWGDEYEIVVADEGRGIPKEELERITEAFYMVDKSRSRREGGAGLGLALCEKIVRLHNAKWEFESAPFEGLKISIHFPLQG